MITKIYKCNNCGIEEVNIQTYDITGRYGKVDMDKLSQRIAECSECPTCGETRAQVFKPLNDYWFEAGIGRGKISSRFK